MISKTGINGPPGPGTGRSDLIQDFLNFVGSGPVRNFSNFLVLVRPGLRTRLNGLVLDKSVLVRGSPIQDFFFELVSSNFDKLTFLNVVTIVFYYFFILLSSSRSDVETRGREDGSSIG